MTIIPAYVEKRHKHERKNTKRHSDGNALRRSIDGIKRHLEQHPADGASSKLLAKFEARLKGV